MLINVEDLTNIQMKNQQDDGTVESLVSISLDSEEEDKQEQESKEKEKEKERKESLVELHQDRIIEVSTPCSRVKRFLTWLAQPTIIDKLFFLFMSLYFLIFLLRNGFEIVALIDKEK